ncbi:hypothetical protein L596_000573 [Steinernema carpocapsae]|uniref:Reverse transcriptase domain-containing protein n=1 Tax=Steinernema carpocapsae TaxID=34508 RepID=A0A4U8UIM5_STECR|nr:hypothetical protein L596_000573 [Steinernema carpocapsae]
MMYRPFLIVAKESSETTPYRMLHNGSACKKGEPSLNEISFKGLLPSMFAILLLFRQHLHVATGDIKKAFNQLGLNDPDRNLLRFFVPKNWNETVTWNNVHLRIGRLNFEVTSSPFLLAAALRLHFSQTDNELDKEILKACYVYNVMVGANKPEELKKRMEKAKSRFDKIGINLRGFTSSSEELNDSWEVKSESTSFLGITWSLTDDNPVLTASVEDLLYKTRIAPAEQHHVRSSWTSGTCHPALSTPYHARSVEDRQEMGQTTARRSSKGR